MSGDVLTYDEPAGDQVVGLRIQAAEAARRIAAGERRTPLWTLEDSIVVLEAADESAARSATTWPLLACASERPVTERVVEIVPDRDRPSGHVLRIDGTDQSYVDLDDPTRLEFDYVQRMADVVDALGTPGDPMRFVHVGGAGMTLPRYVSATRPTSAQIVLEPDERVTALVRDRLPLPRHSGIKVRPVDGRSGVAALRDGFADVVVLDAFDGAQVPAELGTAEFFADLARVLGEGGVALLNLADRAPFPYVRRVVRGVRDSFGQVMISAEPATLKGRRFGNVLVAASQRPLPWQALARRAASSPFPYRVLPYGDVVERFAAPTAFTDADSQPSPPPPGGATFFS